jgi:hypothetical protein
MTVRFGTIGRGRHIRAWVVAPDVDGGAKSDLLMMEVITFFARDFREGGGVRRRRAAAPALAVDPGMGGDSRAWMAAWVVE